MILPFLERLALDSATQPLSYPVPGEQPADFVRQVGASRLGWRALRRRAVLWCSGQRRTRLQRLPAATRQLLWLYEGEQQIGDALMDLAARTMLLEQGIAVDLVCDPAVAPLFAGDPWLREVTAAPEALQPRGWDACVVLSDKSRPLRSKRRWFGTLPWVSLHGPYTGPNFHRGLYVAQRLADLLDLHLTEAERERHARQKLGPVGALPPDLTAGALAGTVALALGGVRAERAYGHWEGVADALIAAGRRRLVLVGSANGQEEARRLAGALAGRADLIDLTGRLDLAGTRAVMDACDAAVCADGGLLHLAATTCTPVVGLFGAGIEPAWRLPADLLPLALSAGTCEVSALPPAKVAGAVLAALEHGRMAAA